MKTCEKASLRRPARESALDGSVNVHFDGCDALSASGRLASTEW